MSTAIGICIFRFFSSCLEISAVALTCIRNLKKKLTQIQQLREKVAGGASLEPEQQSKLDSEADILEEMKALGET